ncbi:Kcna7, partial [Symbiodinium natans]
MLRVYSMSGEELCATPAEELTDVKALKQQLQSACGCSRFRQKLLHQGRVLNDGECLQGCCIDLDFVLLPFCNTKRRPRCYEL